MLKQTAKLSKVALLAGVLAYGASVQAEDMQYGITVPDVGST